MRVLLTGGAGFIGSHLAEGLLQRGEKLVILDDFNDFYDPDIKFANLEEVRKKGISLSTSGTCSIAQRWKKSF